MDFVFESYTQVSDADKQKAGETGSASANSLSMASDLLPPVPSGSLKIPALPEDLTRKFSNLSILKNITQRKTSQLEIDETAKEDNSLALKYAKNSLDLINATNVSTVSMTPSEISEGAASSKSQIPYSMLENRLARVLNTTNFDSSVRQSLLVLQSRIDQNGQIKIRETSNSKDSIDSGSVNYNHLAGTGILGAVARRKLRSEVENDLLSQHYQALKKLQPIVKKLNVIKDDLQDLNEVYSIIQDKLNTQIDENSGFKSTADKLTRERDIISIKKEVLNSFKSSFTLSHYEEHTLRNEDISDEFFNVLAKVEKIYENCDVLLSLNNDKLGIDIMTKMRNLIDSSVDRLSLFVKKQLNIYFLNVSKQGSGEGRSSFQKSDQSQIESFQRALIYILQKRESKFDEVVSEIIHSRSQQVVNDFLIQLNGYNDIVRKEQEEKRQQLLLESQKKKDIFSDPSNLHGNKYNPHPLIDFSYDSKRFLGDLLAYLHGVIANEREIIENLFDLNDEQISNSNTKSSKNMSLIIDSVVNKVIGSLSSPLKSTLEQTMRQESKVLVVQSFFGLLDLYTVMFTKLLSKSGEVNESSTLISTLNKLKESTIERVFNIIQLKLKSIKSDSESEDITDECSIPDWLIDYYSDFFPIFENMDDVQRKFIGDEKIAELTSLVVDGPMNILEGLKEKILTELQLSQRSYQIITINCLDFVSLKLTSIPSLTFKLEEVGDKISALKLDLEKQEFNKLILNSGLFDIYNLINMIFSLDQDFFDISIYEPITENKMFNKQTFIEADIKMTQFLPTVLIDQEDTDLSKLVSPSIASDIVIDSSLKFVDFYYKLLLIVDTYLRTSEDDGTDYFRWDDLRVATLLGVEDQYLKQKVDYSVAETE